MKPKKTHDNKDHEGREKYFFFSFAEFCLFLMWDDVNVFFYILIFNFYFKLLINLIVLYEKIKLKLCVNSYRSTNMLIILLY